MDQEQTPSVFYSWQSDLDDKTNKGLIRDCLNETIALLNTQRPKGCIRLDEATRDMPGSPNIPNTVFKKISEADIFICDLTIINHKKIEDQRSVANPNVLIELGYAVANLGWGRIIMLFNEVYGKLSENLPFDVDRHRASHYKFALKDAGTARGKKNKDKLCELLQIGIETIIKHNPALPQREFNQAHIKRDRDIDTLRKIMETINTDQMDYFLDQMFYSRLYNKLFDYWETFKAMYNSSGFCVYDGKLKKKLLELHKAWNKCLSFSQYFENDRPNDKFFTFHRERDKPFTPEQEKKLEEFCDSARKMDKKYIALLNFIRKNYIEIDINETNKKSLCESDSY